MKLSTVCVVFAAFLAAAAAPARADSLLSTTTSFVTQVFSRLIRTQVLIKNVEMKNYKVLSPALYELSRELHQGLESNIFKIGSGIHNTLVDVNLKIGQISGNASSILSQIDSVANAMNTLNFYHARTDYNIKRSRIQKLCNDTLAMTSVVLQLIDETKEMLGKGVSGPLRTLKLTIELTSSDKLVKENANLKLQQSIIDNPPSMWLFFTDYEAVAVAESLKQVGEETVERIENLVTLILDHATWLQGVCQTIREELDSERTDISKIDGKIKSARETSTAIGDELSSNQYLSDESLREGSRSLVQVMNNLRDEVFNITANRMRRAAEPNDYTATETYHITTEHSSPAIFQDQPRPSWLDKTPDNGCYYIYSNRTVGCISVRTFDFMKHQYNWISDKLLEFQTRYQNYEKKLASLTTPMINYSKGTPNHFEAAKLIADLETKQLLWSDDIKKIRDISVNLNSYAESLFSEANAQLKIRQSNDATLNTDMMRTIDDITKTSMATFNENENDVSDINKQAVVIICRIYGFGCSKSVA